MVEWKEVRIREKEKKEFNKKGDRKVRSKIEVKVMDLIIIVFI